MQTNTDPAIINIINWLQARDFENKISLIPHSKDIHDTGDESYYVRVIYRIPPHIDELGAYGEEAYRTLNLYILEYLEARKAAILRTYQEKGRRWDPLWETPVQDLDLSQENNINLYFKVFRWAQTYLTLSLTDHTICITETDSAW